MSTLTERRFRTYQRMIPDASPAAIRGGFDDAHHRRDEDASDAVIECIRAWEARHGTSMQGPVTTAMKVRQREDLVRLQPWLLVIRKAVFNATAAPFASARAAVSWIREHEEKTRPPFTPEACERYRRAQLELQQAAVQTSRFWEAPKVPRPLLLPYLDGRQERLVEVYVGSPLVPLAKAVEEAHRRTGYGEADLTMLVLCNRALPVRRATAMIHEHVGVDGQSRSVTISLPTPEVITEPQVRVLVRRIRAGLRLRRRRSLQTRDAARLRLANGLPPGEHEKPSAYWERLRLAWNQQPEAGRGIRDRWKMKQAVERVRARL